MKTAVMLLHLVLFTTSASAEVTLKEYQSAKVAGGPDWELMKLYFRAAGTAYLYADATLELDHKPTLFCVPRHLALTDENYIDIIDKQIAHASPPFHDDFKIDGLLLRGLMFTFPCK
jgi:hypothetical protein